MKKFTLLITLVTMFGLTVSAQADLYDRGSGLIYDSELNITWLVHEDFANESMKWDEAIVWAEDLEYYGYTDWRLPTIPCTECEEEGEMKHLYDNESDYMSFFGDYLSDDGALYWYDTEVVSTRGNNNNQAWYLNFDNGKENKKGGTSFVLAVHNGDIANGIINIPLDIKPTSCPNPLNTNNQGVLPVAILGYNNNGFDVTQIDVTSLALEGVDPIRSNLEDVATPFEPFAGKEDCDFDCNELGPDSILDLTLKFDVQEIIAALGEVNDGDCIVLTLTGKLMTQFGGTDITGEDVVRILKKK